MSLQSIQIIDGSAHTPRHRRIPAVTAAILILVMSAATAAAANTSTQNVNVVNTPTVNVGNLPTVTVGALPTVSVGSLPPVSFLGTPTVNATVAFPANQSVTVSAPGPLTNVGRLPSDQVMLVYYAGTISPPCANNLYALASDGSFSCFDIASHAGKILVVTDITWYAAGTSGGTTCGPVILPGAFGFMPSFAVTNTDGWAQKAEHMTTGIKMTVNPSVGSFFGNCTIYAVWMYGYLLPNQ